MNWDQFKDSHCHMCLHGTVVSSLSLMQEVLGSKLTLFKNIFDTFCRICWFYRIHLGKIGMDLPLIFFKIVPLGPIFRQINDSHALIGTGIH